MIMCSLGAHTLTTWMALVGHVLVGLHRSGHTFMRFAPQELNPGPRGLSILGRMCSFGIVAGIGGPAFAGNLCHHVRPREHLGIDTTSFAVAFGGLALLGALQLACCLAFSLQASPCQQEPEGSDAPAEAQMAVDTQAA